MHRIMSSRGRLLSYCRDFRLPQRLDGLNINLKWDLTHDVHVHVGKNLISLSYTSVPEAGVHSNTIMRSVYGQ